jgi:hypothetical protein
MCTQRCETHFFPNHPCPNIAALLTSNQVRGQMCGDGIDKGFAITKPEVEYS